MMRKILYITFIIICKAFFAQTNSGTPNLQLPSIIPPSPTAQNFMRYGEIPVDYSTGVPKIEIPIYTIKGKKLELPISISYHASGIKVHDVSSEVGIGWVLNAGGTISSTILDYNDELNPDKNTYSNAEQFLAAIPNILYNTYSNSKIAVEAFEGYFQNHGDFISDRYFYRLPNGVTGVFRYNYPEKDTIVTLPYHPYKINKSSIDGSITIIDDKGISYKYERAYVTRYYGSEWFLVEMSSPDGAEIIKFNYGTQKGSSSFPTNTFIGPKHFFGENCDPRQNETYPVDNAGGTMTGYDTWYLTSIESNEEIINFTYLQREDSEFQKKLNEITIALKKNPSIIMKKVVFNQSYFGTRGYESGSDRDKRLKLNSVTTYGEDSLVPQNHTFEYEESQTLPSYNSKSIDFWGYYNGTNNGTTLHNDFLPTEYRHTGYGGNRRADNGSFSKAAMLKEIKYPAGGKTVFEFERAFEEGLFQYNSGNTSGYIGGFRVSKITNYTKDNEIANVKSYQYEAARFTPISPEYYNYINKYTDFYVYAPPQGPGDNIELRCNVKYDRTFTTSEPIVSNNIAPGLPILYGKVTEYEGTPENNVGNTIYSYSVPVDFSYVGDLREYNSFQNDEGNYEPKMLSKTIKSSTEKLIYDEYNSYSDHFLQDFNTGINAIKYFDFLALHGDYYNQAWWYMQIDFTNYIAEYIMSIKAHDTKAFQKANLLDYTIKRTYDQSNSAKYVEDRIDYTYNQHNLMINQTSGKNSLGEKIVTKYKYPYDLVTSQPYQTMLSKNILTPVVEQLTTNENKQIQKIETNYKDWGNNIIEPEIIKAQTDSQTPLENKIRYLSYDSKGNPVSVKKEKGTPVTYLWGYNKTLPIAMVENAAYAYQSSTEDQSQQVSYSGLQINPGNTSYELGSITISEEKSYPVERSYERDYSQYSVMYQIVFQHDSNSAYNVTFTDTAPTNQSSLVVETSVNLKPGTYTVKLVNVGYNGYTGKISHDININIKNIAGIKKEIPFHTSFEDDTQNVSTNYSITGKKSHVGSYVVRIPPSSMGINKVIVSYWGKSSASSEWKYVEAILDANGQNYTVGSSDAYVDEVRLYPADAMMTTYTYDPFYKQLTSVMKPNNQVEYYIYDKKGRLERIIDINGKILKEYQYNYKQ